LLLAVDHRLLKASAPLGVDLGCEDVAGLPRLAAEKVDCVEEARGSGVKDEKADAAFGDVTEDVVEPLTGATEIDVK
jgi:hypothetical protein